MASAGAFSNLHMRLHSRPTRTRSAFTRGQAHRRTYRGATAGEICIDNEVRASAHVRERCDFKARCLLPSAQHLALCFNASSGLLASITQKRLGVTLPASQAIGYYRASDASNHYVFTPRENTAQLLPVTKLLVTSQSVSSLLNF